MNEIYLLAAHRCQCVMVLEEERTSRQMWARFEEHSSDGSAESKNTGDGLTRWSTLSLCTALRIPIHLHLIHDDT